MEFSDERIWLCLVQGTTNLIVLLQIYVWSMEYMLTQNKHIFISSKEGELSQVQWCCHTYTYLSQICSNCWSDWSPKCSFYHADIYETWCIGVWSFWGQNCEVEMYSLFLIEYRASLRRFFGKKITLPEILPLSSKLLYNYIIVPLYAQNL